LGTQLAGAIVELAADRLRSSSVLSVIWPYNRLFSDLPSPVTQKMYKGPASIVNLLVIGNPTYAEAQFSA
jgi:hypothetical protein